MIPEISIVIPMYNEGKVVLETLDLVFATMDPLKIPYEVIAVNDKSKDKTALYLDEFKKRRKHPNLKIMHNRRNMGYGASLKNGITESKGKYIIISDADGTYPIADIPRFVKRRESYDMVIGARVSKNVHIPLMRRPAKWFLNRLSSVLVGKKIHDLNSGLRIFRKDMCLEFWNLYPERFSFTSTITIASMLNNYEVKYIPIDYFKRKGSSSISPWDFARFSSLILKILVQFRPIKMFSLISGFMLLSAIMVFVIGYFGYGILFDSTIAILAISSLQMFTFGILADLMVKRK